MESISAEGETIVYRGENVIITACLLQNGTYGDPVQYQIVEFFAESSDDFIGSARTDINGYASIIWDVPNDYPLGSMIMNVTFRGNQSLALLPAYQQMSMLILSSTEIALEVQDYSLAPLDDLCFVVTLVNDLQEPLSGEFVVVTSDSILLANGFTNASGQTYFRIQCNSSWADLGTNIVDVEYSGNLVTFNEDTARSFTITLIKLDTVIEPCVAYPKTVLLNESLILFLEASVSDTVLSDTILNLSIDGHPYDSVVTNESGIVEISIDMDKQYSLGEHVLLVEYLGTERLMHSSFVVEFDVVSFVIVGFNVPNVVLMETMANLDFEVTDIFDRGLPQVSVVVYDPSSGEISTTPIPPNSTLISASIHMTGQKGSRLLVVNITGCSYLVNASFHIRIVVWTQPSLVLIQSNVVGFASPNQGISMHIHLGDKGGNYSDRFVSLNYLNGTVIIASVTNDDGLAILSFSAPEMSTEYFMQVVYEGLNTSYELPTYINYGLTVTEMMPIALNILDYSVIAPLQELYVVLMLHALNGSYLSGIHIVFHWFQSVVCVLSQSQGLVELHLQVPQVDGLYNLSYSTREERSLLSNNGLFILEITSMEIAMVQGVGIPVIASSFCVSLGFVCVPVLKRRYLIG